MSNLQSGDSIRHKTWGIGTIERIERNAFGNVTRAWVRFRGNLHRVWIDDAALVQAGAPPEPDQRRAFGVVDGGAAA